ncbi:hypothetical protein C2S52_005979 [Perilla frutescens var. hirtella]|nr:hypothetical protein C2S52_005979 [Perilla frutescens var. hirtella]
MPDSAAAGGGSCCRCCCNLIITSGLTALFLWLSLRTSKPTCSIEKLYVAALNTTDNSAAARSNRTIYFDLKLANSMKDKGVHYANITLNFYYNSTIPVANYTVPEFYQGHKKSTRRRDLVAATGVPWAAALDAVSNGSAVSFRVRLATRVKFKILFWYTKRHALDVAGDVQVNATGNKVNKKGVKLKKSAAPPPPVRVGPVVFFTFLIMLLL